MWTHTFVYIRDQNRFFDRFNRICLSDVYGTYIFLQHLYRNFRCILEKFPIVICVGSRESIPIGYGFRTLYFEKVTVSERKV